MPVSLPKEVEAREEAVKQYFRQRINKLIAENQELQSKSLALLAEVNRFNNLFFWWSDWLILVKIYPHPTQYELIFNTP